MKTLNKKGFTLIELLIVIAIIGILATMGLVAFQNSRKKGMDTKIRNAVNQVKTQAEVFYDDNQSYDGLGADASVTKMINEVAAVGSTLTVTPSADGTSYIAYAQLMSNTSFMCVDSEGNAKTEAASPAGQTTCP